MPIIITADIERAARRTDRTLRIGQGDTISPEARALAERLGVRIVRPNGPEVVVSPSPLPSEMPPPSPTPEPVSRDREVREQPVAEPPVQLPPLAPAPNPAEVLARWGQGVAVEPERPVPRSPTPSPSPLPLERYGAGEVLDPVERIGRPIPRPATPPPPVRPLVETPPSRPSEAPPSAVVLPVQRIPVATPPPSPSPAPEPAAPPVEQPSQPDPTLSARRLAPSSYRQRRRIARSGASPSQMGILLGHIIGTREVRRAAEAGVRLVRIGPEAYVTRSARRLAATLGVVLYPDSSLLDVDDRTKAGTVVNPISLEPAVTRRGPGVVQLGGTPIGGDHLPGTLLGEEGR